MNGRIVHGESGAAPARRDDDGSAVRTFPVPWLGPNVVTMLRYWGTERTLWLRDAFAARRPLAAPALAIAKRATSVHDDPARRAADARVLSILLARPAA